MTIKGNTRSAKGTGTRDAKSTKSTRELDWEEQDVWEVELKYIGYSSTECVKRKQFLHLAGAKKERLRIIKQIQTDGGMDMEFNSGVVRNMFVFQAKFNSINLKMILATERRVSALTILRK